MDKKIFEEIARELKMLNNEAVELIKIKKYEEAKKMYQIASNISELVGYKQGVGMSAYSLANIEIIKKDHIAALHYTELAYANYSELVDKEEASSLIKKLALQLVRDGIEQEKQRNIDEALKFFNYALPHLNKKRKEVILYEITMLRRMKTGE